MEDGHPNHGWQRAVITISAMVTTVVVIGALYWAQAVFIPLGMALFLAFLLNPAVRGLERRGLRRLPAVIAAVCVLALVLSSVGWLLARQTTDLMIELPKYSTTIRQKIESLRGIGAGAKQVLDEIAGDEKNKKPPPDGKEAERVGPDSTTDRNAPIPVVILAQPPFWLQHLLGYMGAAVGALAGLVLVLVLVFFMLLGREDLRNRFLRLVGHGRMSLTTKAVDDAGQRISRFLVMQALVNFGVGTALALGLWALGVERPFQWGLLAAVLRYVPYIGIWIAALLLSALCVAVFPDWAPALLVLGLFLLIELVAANLLEPRLFGQSIGVSEIAFLVAALFWGFLWGPIGLVLSSPLTVCLLVMGKHIPELQFLEVVLGDEPALNLQSSYYQRLIARDQDEAAVLALNHAEVVKESIYDDLLLPTLGRAKTDRERGDLVEADEQFILQAIRESMEDWSNGWCTATKPPSDRPRCCLLGFPARDAADRLALDMLQQSLDPEKWQCEFATTDTLPSEFLKHVADVEPVIVCISAMPPGGFARTRYLCKRLRSQCPTAAIVVGQWGLESADPAQVEALRDAGADFVASTIAAVRDHLNRQFSLLNAEECHNRICETA